MTYDENRDESEIRRRAAWLLGMLAVVAALLVVLMVFFLGSSKGSSNNNADPDPHYGDPTVATTHPTSGGTGTPSTHSSPGRGQSSSTAVSTGPVPKAHCPSSSTCTVQGDIGGALAAINDLRSQHGLSTVQASTSHAADQCALSSGSDCPQSFVWVHVDNLSGKAVVAAVEGFSGTDDLLDSGAKKFAIGWAYDPGSQASSAAVIEVS
ncbi:hypothetical protein [Jatrophihabitans endophyticus]|uniref:hypothetical protein n=1 Tax=Jatrophihabitans endophyticus TaxID=1206085 RepID=UPI0019DDE97F|nr:hypothetical protein [Jatrophihabitans endophyticus]MBE7187425.1 hypothetical protein [Jatrophihabitans endophyticus]